MLLQREFPEHIASGRGGIAKGCRRISARLSPEAHLPRPEPFPVARSSAHVFKAIPTVSRGIARRTPSHPAPLAASVRALGLLLVSGDTVAPTRGPWALSASETAVSAVLPPVNDRLTERDSRTLRGSL